jgi:hypothetical protein
VCLRRAAAAKKRSLGRLQCRAEEPLTEEDRMDEDRKYTMWALSEREYPQGEVVLGLELRSHSVKGCVAVRALGELSLGEQTRAAQPTALVPSPTPHSAASDPARRVFVGARDTTDAGAERVEFRRGASL